MAREIAIAAMTAKLDMTEDVQADKPKRKPIPDHIPRIEVELTPRQRGMRPVRRQIAPPW